MKTQVIEQHMSTSNHMQHTRTFTYICTDISNEFAILLCSSDTVVR